jgi:K+-sensing histidine kinase KdpD
MQKRYLNISLQLIQGCVLAVMLVLATTTVFLLIGRNTLGEGVIALLYLVPISWSTTRWGQLAGMCAAVTAFLNFNFFFIPPFYTLVVGTVEGWLLLIIFLAVATVIVGRIQFGLTQAQTREREAVFMYELSTALVRAHTPEAVARTVAGQLQQDFQAALVQVMVQVDRRSTPILASAPAANSPTGEPDYILPLLAAQGLIGEIRLWHGWRPLPSADGRLLQNFATQSALAIERSVLE